MGRNGKRPFPEPTFPLPHPEFARGQADARDAMGARRCEGAEPYTWEGHLRTCAYCAGWESRYALRTMLQLPEPVRLVLAYWQYGLVK